MPLTDPAIRKAKPADKPRKLFDGGGLYLEIAPSGGKWWRLKYRHAGKEKRVSLGTYPDVPLAEARKRRDKARELIAGGQDPAAVKRAERIASTAAAAETFEAIGREWFAKFSPQWAPGHADKIIARLDRDIFPWIGKRPIAEITAPELLQVLRRIEARGAVETAHRAQQNCGQVFRYAVATGRAQSDPTASLRGALAPPVKRHHASTTDPQAIGELLRAIDGYQGSFVTRCALKLAPLLFVRPGELRRAEWQEIDFDKAEWRIPAHKMKARAPHIVPLCVQAVAVLRELYPLTGQGIPAKPDAPRYVFPGERTRTRPMSENTVNAALRRLGYSKDQMTGHGFRSMASTLLNEQGWHRDAIERQLAHAERDAVRAAYNYAEHLPERRRMMQAWADYLDRLREGRGKVVAIGSARA